MFFGIKGLDDLRVFYEVTLSNSRNNHSQKAPEYFLLSVLTTYRGGLLLPYVNFT